MHQILKKRESDLQELLAALSDRPKALDLFSGIGGLSLGLEQAGFHVLCNVEIEELAGRYASYNFPHCRVLYGSSEGDVRKLKGKDLELKKGQLAIVAGGPPCQGFSLAGKKRADDPLNDLVCEMARVVLELEPLCFLIENVPGLTASNSPHLAEALSMLGRRYRIAEPEILSAADYGVPQMRKRVFFVGMRRDLKIDPSLPKPTHLPPKKLARAQSDLFIRLPPTPTVRDAISDIPNVDDYFELIDGDRISYPLPPSSDYQKRMRQASKGRGDCSVVPVWQQTILTNVRRTRHGDELLDRLRKLSFGRADKISGIRRLDPEDVSTTIRAGTVAERGSWSAPRPLHYAFDRVLTTRECARIQSFPDWFYFHPVKWHGNRQVGNAVAPLLARTIGQHLLGLLGISVPNTKLPHVSRDETLVAQDIADAANSGLSTRAISQKVTHPRIGVLNDRGRRVRPKELR
jgi:DNA (cytosine-5)-methyltransferase 1